MSLSLPDNYKRSNFEENWIFQLYNNDTYISFDGSNDFIDLGTTNSSISSIASNITVSFWVRFSPEVLNSSTNVIIFESNTRDNYISGFRIFKDTADRMSILISDADDNTDYCRIRGGDFDANVWYFITITSDMDGSFFTSSNTKIYIDNVSQGVSLYGTGWDSNHSVGYSGSGKTMFSKTLVPDPDTFSKFQIKNFAIWNVQLDSNNRTAIYNSGTFTTLKNNFGNYNKSGNLKAYWEFNSGSNYVEDLSGNVSNGTVTGAKYGGFLPLALSDTTVDDVTYHGFVTKAGSIRDTINLQNSSAKSSNLSISVGDFTYENDKLSKQVLFGNKYYINKTVKVYSQPINKSNIDSCVQIYNGRLTDVDISSNGLLNFSFASKTPWDFITFPQTKTPVTKTYIPVVYGDYTPNISFLNTPAFCDTDLYPVPVLRINDEEIITLMPRSYSSGSNAHVNMYQGQDAFIPLATDSGGVDDETTTQFENTNTIRTKLSKKAVGTIRGREATDTLASGTEFSNMHNAFDGDENTFSTVVVPSNGLLASYLMGFTTGISDKFHEHDIIKIDLSHKYSVNDANISLFIAPSPYAGGTETSTTPDFVANTLLATSLNIVSSPAGNQKVSVPYKLLYTNFDNAGTISINDIKVTIKTEFFAGDADEDENDKQSLSEIKFMYSGGDGLLSSITDTTTVSGTITSGLHAHRDLLARFTGYDVPDSDLYNWSSNLNVNSLRSAWNIRYWALEPVELKKVLQQIQKEFAFIFKWRPNGEGSYWTVKDSYSSGDVVTTLDIDDISNLKINHTPFSDLITKMDVNYKKHPADDRMLLTQTSQDSTSSPTPRDKWSIRTKENLLSVDLEMNVDKPGNEDVGHADSDPNDGYADYYMNIFGDIKKAISCEIVNPAKGYILETGDIIKFDIDEIKPFGGDWSNYYMVTSIQRSIGKIKINCREVG